MRRWFIPTVSSPPDSLAFVPGVSAARLRSAVRVLCPCRLGLRPSLGRPSPASQRATRDLWSDPQLLGFTREDLRPECESLALEWVAGASAGATSASGGHPSSRSPDPPGCPRPPAQPPQAPCLLIAPTKVELPGGPDPSGLCCPTVMSRGPFRSCADGVSLGLCPVPLLSLTASSLNPCPSSAFLSSFALSGHWKSTRSPIKASSWGPHFPLKVCILPLKSPEETPLAASRPCSLWPHRRPGASAARVSRGVS